MALVIKGYKIIRTDHPRNTQKGGVCIYYKEDCATSLLQTHFLRERIVCEMYFHSKKSDVVSSHSSPTQ